MAPLKHVVRVSRVSQGERQLKTSRGDTVAIQPDTAIQITRDLKVTQNGSKITFDQDSVSQAENIYGTTLGKDNVLPILAQAIVHSSDEISMLHQRLINLETQTAFTLPSIPETQYQPSAPPADYLQMVDQTETSINYPTDEEVEEAFARTFSEKQ